MHLVLEERNLCVEHDRVLARELGHGNRLGGILWVGCDPWDGFTARSWPRRRLNNSKQRGCGRSR